MIILQIVYAHFLCMGYALTRTILRQVPVLVTVKKRRDIVGDKYKVSKELGRKPKQPDPVPEEEIESILDITPDVENVEVDGRFYFLNGYEGKAENCVVVKSDVAERINATEELTGKIIVGLVVLSDGTLQLLMEKI